jgi:multidrug resistance efflux pump
MIPCRRGVAIAAAAVALGLGLLAATSRSQAETTTVTLAATGTVQAPQQLALGVANPGRLIEVDAHPGEHVERGRLLARLDPAAAIAALATARANLDSARAQLLQLRQGLSPAARAQIGVTIRQAKTTLTAADRAVLDARDGAAQDNTRLRAAVTQAGAQVASDQQKLVRDQAKLAADQATLNADQEAAGGAAAQLTADRAQLARDEAHLLADQKQQIDDQAAAASAVALAADARAILDDQAAVAADQAKLADDTGTAADARAAVTADESRVDADQQAVGADQDRIAADQDAATNAQNAAAAGAVSEHQSLHTAESARAAAQLGVAAGRAAGALQLEAPRAGTLAAARAVVTTAEASVAAAAEALRETRLVAPFAGTIATVSAVSGQLVPAPGGGGLVTLVNLEHLTVTASFDGAEAALLAPDQRATVTVTALAGQRLAGRVSSLDPLPDAPASNPAARASSPGGYTATIALGNPPQIVRPGMQVQVAVQVETTLRSRR